MLGLAYKKNVDDMRESPSAVIMEKLTELGAQVDYSDPHIAEFPETREHDFDLASVEISAAALAGYDCVLIATDHDAFDYELIAQHAKLIVDARGRYLQPLDKVVRA